MDRFFPSLCSAILSADFILRLVPLMTTRWLPVRVKTNESSCMSSRREGKSLPQPWDTRASFKSDWASLGCVPTSRPVRATRERWMAWTNQDPSLGMGSLSHNYMNMILQQNWGSIVKRGGNGHWVINQQHLLKMEKALSGKKGHSTLGQC